MSLAMQRDIKKLQKEVEELKKEIATLKDRKKPGPKPKLAQA